MPRKDRGPDQLRTVTLATNFTEHAEGSVLCSFGRTRVLCTATAEERVPSHVKGSGRGWVTAEYGMLPRSTHTRSDREAAKGKQSGRTQEIQRLIGRALRAAVDLQTLGERQVLIDCDVLQADGGTRTAAITGGYAALGIALRRMQREKALRAPVAAISVGILAGQALLDLDYEEDFSAGKLAEIREILAGIALELLSLRDVRLPPPDETGATFHDNAAQKSTICARQSGLWTLADDSGLCVDALGGAPGVHSARYAPTDEERRVRLLQALREIPEEKRTAYFFCAVALSPPEGERVLRAEGQVDGRIAFEERGTNGFGS